MINLLIFNHVPHRNNDSSFGPITERNSIGKIWTYLGNIQYKEYKIEQKKSHDVWLEKVKWEL